MDKQLIEKIAKRAVDGFVKEADFGLMALLKQLLGGVEGLGLGNMIKLPLAQSIGGVAGLPGIAGMLDLFKGGENISTLMGYGNFMNQGGNQQSSAAPAGQATQATGPQQAGQTPAKPPAVAPSAPQTTPAPTPPAPIPPPPKPVQFKPALSNSYSNAKVG